MRFLVTGASGFLGFALVERLAELFGKQSIQALCSPSPRTALEARRLSRLQRAGFDVVTVDLLGHRSWPQLLPFDVLYHLAAFTETETQSPALRVNDEGTAQLLENLAGMLPGKRVVFTSSLAAVDRAFPSSRPHTETDACVPRTPYGQSKLDAEQIAQRQGARLRFDWSILRLPTVYGPGFRPGGMFARIAADLRHGRLATRIAWPGRISLAFVDDVVQTLTDLGTADEARNMLFHFGSPCSPTFDEVIERSADLLGVKRERIVLPEVVWATLRRMLWLPFIPRMLPFALRIAAWRVSLVISDGMVADGQKLNAILPRRHTPLDVGLAATYLAHGLGPASLPSAIRCSIIVPCRNERGNIAPLVQRLPDLGGHTELIFVEGHSTDGTLAECERVRGENPKLNIRVLRQTGKGKGDAVLQGFAAATGDVLIILDADLSVPPESLPEFVNAAAQGPGRLLVGSRFLYPMERGAMRFLNSWGNRFFTALLNAILGTQLTDTLCGTKVIWRSDYDQLLATNYGFARADPFGDFNLLFGAALLGLDFDEIPVRYRRRTYGTTQIRRFRDGLSLLRLVWEGRRMLAANAHSRKGTMETNAERAHTVISSFTPDGQDHRSKEPGKR